MNATRSRVKFFKKEKLMLGACLAVQWLRLCLPVHSVGLIPDGGTKSPHASGPKTKI